jgi:SAM-dependent methyltransferase
VTEPIPAIELEVVHAILDAATDRSSLSDELHLAAHSAFERTHLARGRANLLRAIDLPVDATVLEVGAGCGALTRYLGETAASVDAVEPDLTMAATARARTAGLDNVVVHVGDVTDLPDDPVYDVAVVVDGPGVGRLADIQRRLVPGGVLIMAVGNRFGVGRLTGTGNRAAPGLGRRELDRMLAAAGFVDWTVLGAFPDHTTTRVVMAAELASSQPRLAAALPRMAGDERRMWHDIVYAADAMSYVNSFLVLVTTQHQTPSLWPADRLAIYLNTDRAASLCGRAEVVGGPATPVIHRAPIAHRASGAVRVRSYQEPVHDGPTLLELIYERPNDGVELLGRWLRLLHEGWGKLGPASWDLVPHNVIMTGGAPRPIDLEWEVDGIEPADVVGRGLLLTADQLARQGWAGAGERSTVYELAGWLTVATGHDLRLIHRVVEREAWFQAVCTVGHTGSPALEIETECLRRAWFDRLAEPVEEARNARH